MKIIAWIEQEEILKKILKHVGLWDVQKRTPPKANAPPGLPAIDYVDIQYPDENYRDPNYPFEAYI